MPIQKNPMEVMAKKLLEHKKKKMSPVSLNNLKKGILSGDNPKTKELHVKGGKKGKIIINKNNTLTTLEALKLALHMATENRIQEREENAIIIEKYLLKQGMPKADVNRKIKRLLDQNAILKEVGVAVFSCLEMLQHEAKDEKIKEKQAEFGIKLLMLKTGLESVAEQYENRQESDNQYTAKNINQLTKIDEAVLLDYADSIRQDKINAMEYDKEILTIEGEILKK